MYSCLQEIHLYLNRWRIDSSFPVTCYVNSEDNFPLPSCYMCVKVWVCCMSACDVGVPVYLCMPVCTFCYLSPGILDKGVLYFFSNVSEQSKALSEDAFQ